MLVKIPGRFKLACGFIIQHKKVCLGQKMISLTVAKPDQQRRPNTNPLWEAPYTQIFPTYNTQHHRFCSHYTVN